MRPFARSSRDLLCPMPIRIRAASILLPADHPARKRAQRNNLSNFSASDPPTMPTYSLSKTDAVDWLRTLPSASVDLLITDPPYESLEKHRAIGTTTRLKHSKASSNNWFQIFPNKRFPELFSEFWRVLKQDSHLYLFSDPETMFVAKPLVEDAGFRFWKPLIWDKMQIGMGYHYRARYECILFFEKGKRRLHNLGIADIIQEPRIRGGYPAEKPVRVSEILIQQSSESGDVVIDPFMGSGSVGVAATRNGRHFWGNDINDDAHHATEPRLRNEGARLGNYAPSHLRRPVKGRRRLLAP